MDWHQYEHEIEEQFRANYPSAQVTHNAKLLGKFSKIDRQIDLLIEEQASDFAFRIVVDAKFRGKKIDVGEVEAFLGLTRDVGAHVGVMVALEGYTQAAINRAHYDDVDVYLDVLNLDELKAFQGLVAITYSGENGACILAPFGWVVEGTRRPNMLASLYQRGLTLEEAQRSDEWMYINFWDKKNDDIINNLETLLEYQKEYMLKGSPDAETSFLEGAQGRKDGVRTLVRRFKKKGWSGPEYTGFVDFEDFIFMCVLLTSDQFERKNLRKLRQVLKQAIPMKVQHDHTQRIEDAEEQVKQSKSVEGKAHLLCQIGRWYRDMGRLGHARHALEDSLSLVPHYYEGVKQLLVVLAKLRAKNEALELMGRLLRLDPHNPTVFKDCFDYARPGLYNSSDFVRLFEALRTDYPEDLLVQANCDFYEGQLLMTTDSLSARNLLMRALGTFRKLFPRGHQVFAALRSALRQLSKEKASHLGSGTT